jgi:hypothetical protein
VIGSALFGGPPNMNSIEWLWNWVREMRGLPKTFKEFIDRTNQYPQGMIKQL